MRGRSPWDNCRVQGADGIGCEFCDLSRFAGAELLIVRARTFFAADSFGTAQVLPGAGVVSPIAHRESPFELSADEWADTRAVLHEAKSVLDERLRPDGYNLIWNVQEDAGQLLAHVHLHVIPRFHDEPLAGRGARWHLKQDVNRRPDPLAPGNGRAVSSPAS
jgi:diadenosine tetraphosphate (Ap4A) HIT family hydrolase